MSGRRRPRDDDRRQNGSAEAEGDAGASNAVLYAAGAVPEALDAAFPAMEYTSRHRTRKTVLHWGQRKLLLSELQLLVEALATCGPTTKFHIIYPGAAPGSHLLTLADMFPGHTWELHDPIPFDPRLVAHGAFQVVPGYYTNASARAAFGARLRKGSLPALQHLYETHFADEATADIVHRGDENMYEGAKTLAEETKPAPGPGWLALMHAAAARAPTLLVSDIRSGSTATFTGEGDAAAGEEQQDNDDGAPPASSNVEAMLAYERAVEADHATQRQWVQILQPTFALLKFRPPFRYLSDPATKAVLARHPTEHFAYLSGRVLLPVWTRPTSTECRLLVPAGAGIVDYGLKLYEDQCYFFNAVVRERLHFEHPVSDLDPATARAELLDHRFDAAAEIHRLYRVLALRRAATAIESGSKQAAGDPILGSEIVALSRQISDGLGRGFADAQQLQHINLLRSARRRHFEPAMKSLLASAAAFRDADVWWAGRPAGVKPMTLAEVVSGIVGSTAPAGQQ